MKKKILITKAGDLRFVYDDRLRGLLNLGEATITRASDVEPVGTAWSADLGRVGGPVLPAVESRVAAVNAEVEWLNEHLRELP